MITQGFVLLDVDVVALNNSGKDETTNYANAVATKKVSKNGKTYVYVSGQAWRYWWRETLKKQFNWNLSPVIREAKIAFTSANPVQFPDDDIFGYMRAAKEEVTDEHGKKKSENITVTRLSPLKNSVLVSAAAVRTATNWSSMSRQEGDAVPFIREEYSAILKGMFSLDLEMAGTFSNMNRTGFKNISKSLAEELKNTNAKTIEDKFNADEKGQPLKLFRLPDDIRKQRIKDTISALKYISGGAMQTTNMGDVSPKFIIVATMTTGNHPFVHVASETGAYGDVTQLNIASLEEIITDYKDKFAGKVFIGRREGFLDDYDADLKKLQEKHSEILEYASVVQAIDNYVKQLDTQI